MRRGAALLLLAALGGQAACRGGGAPDAPPEASGPSRAERERVRAFWQRYEAAESLRRAGRWTEAAEAYDAALALEPDHEDALYGRANCLLELDRHAEALPLLEHLVAVNPLSQRAHVQLGYLRSCPGAACCFDLRQAEVELERATAINREETGALLRLAELRLVLDEREDAARLLEQVRRTNSHSVGAPWLLAWLAWSSARVDEAASLLREAGERARGPALPSAVPAEGDTRGDHRLVGSTLPERALLPPVWDGLAERGPAGTWSPGEVAAELARLEPALARIASAREGS